MLVRRETPSRELGRLPLELLQKIATSMPPLPEPTRDEVNEVLSAIKLRMGRGRVVPFPCKELVQKVQGAHWLLDILRCQLTRSFNIFNSGHLIDSLQA